jgi:hypothetical protein
MDQSVEIKELAEALSKFQKEVKPVKKDSNNPFFKSKYASLDSIWDAIREPLTRNGLAIAQATGSDGPTIFLETILMHTSGEWIRGKLPLMLSKEDAQGMGSAITYARRYALSALVGVVSDEDNDGNNTEPDKGKKAESKPASSELAQLFRKACIAAGYKVGTPEGIAEVKAWMKKAGKTDLEFKDLSPEKQGELINMMKAQELPK